MDEGLMPLKNAAKKYHIPATWPIKEGNKPDKTLRCEIIATFDKDNIDNMKMLRKVLITLGISSLIGDLHNLILTKTKKTFILWQLKKEK